MPHPPAWAADLAAAAPPAHDIVLTCEVGVEVHVCRAGGIVRRLLVPGADGERADVVLGYDDTLPYVDGSSGAYHGAVIGRYANRIGGAALTLDGRTFPLPANNGPHCLHGGLRGWDKRLWSVSGVAPPPPPGGSAVRLELASPDGEEGFPGALDVVVTYTLRPEGALAIRFEARLVGGGGGEEGRGGGGTRGTGAAATPSASTVVSMTQHAYFNLAGHGAGPLAGAGAGPASAHALSLPGARHYTPVDGTARPLPGPPAPVAGTPFDFFTGPRCLADAAADLCGASPRAPGEALASNGGFDHNFVLALPPFSSPDWSGGGGGGGGAAPSPPARPLARAAVLSGPAPGNRVLEVWTDAPGVQLYTGNFLGGAGGGGEGEAAGKGGATYARHGGVCLETQAFPDSPGRPEWAGAVTLVPGGPGYSHTCEWRFGVGAAGAWPTAGTS